MLLLPSLILGLGGVIFWKWGEGQGGGDLRIYIFTQFFTIAVIPVVLLLYKSRYRYSYYLWYVLAAYVSAKICESNDVVIFEMNDVLSGHNIKHLIAALAPLYLLLMLKRRKVES